MLLSGAAFDKRLANGDLHIALIGMSNIGKSYTARRIAKAKSFAHYDVDALIQEKMGNPSMEAMAEWMGQPYEGGYAQRAAEYLKLEAELTLAANQVCGNQVLDTTGSVIHVSKNTIKTIKSGYLIIYIKAAKADIDMLTKLYFKYPKPTIWGDSFHPNPDLPKQTNVLNCYPDLLKIRATLYAGLADITVEAKDLLNPDLADVDILPMFRRLL